MGSEAEKVYFRPASIVTRVLSQVTMGFVLAYLRFNFICVPNGSPWVHSRGPE